MDMNYIRPNKGDTVAVVGLKLNSNSGGFTSGIVKGFVYAYSVSGTLVNTNRKFYTYEVQPQRTIVSDNITIKTTFTPMEMNNGANCNHHVIAYEERLIPVNMLLIERNKRYD